MKRKIYYGGAHQEKGFYEIESSLACYLLETGDWYEGEEDIDKILQEEPQEIKKSLKKTVAKN